ncbi:hypothetical protein AB4371_19655 [Vibrio sp. 10N.261.51.A3]|uniref:hypothetical protein n=1 Tax=Vibrio sp. 10N.261.51.A3 TaxID=3229673 RepID=UPI0035529139
MLKTYTLLTMALLFSSMVLAKSASTSDFKAYLKNPDLMKPNSVTYFTDTLLLSNSASLNFEATRNETGKIFWVLKTEYAGKDWIFVDRLSFNIDGEVYQFDSTHDQREVLGAGKVRVWERNLFITSPEFMTKLANASDVTTRVSGSNYYVEDNIKNELWKVKWFVIHASNMLTKPTDLWCKETGAPHSFCE